jgi:hypothetical protein
MSPESPLLANANWVAIGPLERLADRTTLCVWLEAVDLFLIRTQEVVPPLPNASVRAASCCRFTNS